MKDQVIKVWHIDVERDSYTTVTRERDSDDCWDRDSTSTHWTIEGLKLVEQEGYKTATVPFKPQKGKVYHLLYAVYSTGDSFGHDEGRCFEVIGVYRNHKVAEDNEKVLRFKPEPGHEFEAVDLKTEGLGIHKYSRPWMGYFESLDILEVRSLILN